MVRPETFFIVPTGHAWSLFRGEQPIEVSFVDVGAALDAAVELGNGHPFRIIVQERLQAAACAA